MGWFSPSYTDSEMQDVAKQIRSSIDTYIWCSIEMQDANKVTMAIQNRLCHLIYRMDTKGTTSTAIGAKWYLEQLAIRNNLPNMSYFDNLRQRLQILVDAFEQNRGLIDTTYFNKLLEYAEVDTQQILMGVPLFVSIEPSHDTAVGALSRFVSRHMWVQTFIANNR